ncbi:MAG: hypothetical protein AAF696_22160 [Bacteroidota bacterium]
MQLQAAKDIDDIYKAFRSQPLKVEEMDAFYEDVASARSNSNPRRRMKRLIKRSELNGEQILFVGYKGSGKSTELNHLEMELQDDFLVINFSVMSELDPVHLQYIELFIVTMEQLFHKADEEKLDIKKELLQRIANWGSTKEILKIRDEYFGAELEAGVELKPEVPFLAKFFAKFKTSAKNSQSLKVSLKNNVEPKLSDLIEHCNDLIKEIRLALQKQGKENLLIIIEDLDKIPPDRAEDLFFNYINQLTLLRAHVIFTFPVSLYHSIRFNQIRNYFTSIQELFIIKVAEKDGGKVEEGIEAMRQVVKARLEIDNFEEEIILEKMILKSGGCLRDLFYLIREAAEFSLDDDREKINQSDYEKAYLRLKRDYENTIADYMEDGKVKYGAAQYYEVLNELAASEDKNIENTEIILHLRQNLCILGYNGEGWYDVHPIVKDILKDRVNVSS